MYSGTPWEEQGCPCCRMRALKDAFFVSQKMDRCLLSVEAFFFIPEETSVGKLAVLQHGC